MDGQTLREIVTAYLKNSGLDDAAAAAVLSLVTASVAGATKWDDRSTAYPPQLVRVILEATRVTALTWIDANCPKAWYRLMFVVKED